MTHIDIPQIQILPVYELAIQRNNENHHIDFQISHTSESRACVCTHIYIHISCLFRSLINPPTRYQTTDTRHFVMMYMRWFVWFSVRLCRQRMFILIYVTAIASTILGAIDKYHIIYTRWWWLGPSFGVKVRVKFAIINAQWVYDAYTHGTR